MITRHDFLFEIGCEELPAKSLQKLSDALQKNLITELAEKQLTYGDIKSFATPRRLAILIKDLIATQPKISKVRRGPALNASFDSDKKPTKAAEGFARSCSVTVEQLGQDDAGLYFSYEEGGKATKELLSEILEKVTTNLPIAKPMTWGNSGIYFARPVHWMLMLYDSEIIKTKILGREAGGVTYGHRFHHSEKIAITKPIDYELQLEKSYVIADFAKRRESIAIKTQELAAQHHGHAVIDEELLDEVTGLVEWPVPLFANFAKRFLTTPSEAIISALKHHQKCFYVVDGKGNLLPHFITISNIESKDQDRVIKGNERVVTARLEDAAFFYHTDCKQRLDARLEKLQQVVFQAKLGSLYDKSQRIAAIAKYIIATTKQENADLAYRAGLLCKADLVTDMVGEFPELQGVMGRYYAEHDGENKEVAEAIAAHYQPRFAGDKLPATQIGAAVALADRLDTLVGIFSIKQIPTGEKDPFGLRRAALGVLRILIENKIELNLRELLTWVLTQGYQQKLDDSLVDQIQTFIFERLRAWYIEKEITPDTLEAVLAIKDDVPLNLDRRVMAVHQFRAREEAQALAAANKRAKNILTKSEAEIVITSRLFKQALLVEAAEKNLHQAMMQVKTNVDNYEETLANLASLKEPVDQFFDSVRVDTDDQALRNNRLALLLLLREMFLSVADISLLQG